MKKSIMRGTLPPRAPLAKLLEAVKKAGFEGIQLGVTQPPLGELFLKSTDAEVKDVAKACKDAGVAAHSILGGVTFFHEDAAARKQAVEDGKRVVEIAAILGAKTWLIHPGQLSPEVPYDACYRYSVEGLNGLKKLAEMTHLRIGLENVWNKFLMSPLEAVRLADEVGSPMVGIWFDIGNCVPFAYPEQWLRILGKKHIVGIHVKEFKRGPNNNFGTYDGFVPLFHGSVNWREVMRQLVAIGFDDYLITEVSLGQQPLANALAEISGQLDVLLDLAKAKDEPKP